MIGAVIALALVAYVALHEWLDTLIDVDTRVRIGLLAIVAATVALGAVVDRGARILWGWLA